jgi:hypothetical protein
MPRSKSEAEALQRLRARLQATQAAAQALADEAAAERSSERPPPAGWDVPGRAEDANAEIEAFLSLLRTLRDVLPPELREQLAELARALLVFVRAVLDFAIERLELAEGGRGDDPDVEDIPIT